jgi:hypothetical protein
MNEEQWLASGAPYPMLEYQRGNLSDRKLRLFAVACCRRIWDLLVDERSREAVKTAEQFADGLVNRAKLVAARDWAREAKSRFTEIDRPPAWRRASSAAFDATRDTGRSAAYNASAEASRALNILDDNTCEPGELREQANLLRCLAGNPFRPATINPAWLSWSDDTVPRLARGIYEERAFDRMPILGDALEDAGCKNPNILAHCRSQSQHMRGCWVVDAILRK